LHKASGQIGPWGGSVVKDFEILGTVASHNRGTILPQGKLRQKKKVKNPLSTPSCSYYIKAKFIHFTENEDSTTQEFYGPASLEKKQLLHQKRFPVGESIYKPTTNNSHASYRGPLFRVLYRGGEESLSKVEKKGGETSLFRCRDLTESHKNVVPKKKGRLLSYGKGGGSEFGGSLKGKVASLPKPKTLKSRGKMKTQLSAKSCESTSSLLKTAGPTTRQESRIIGKAKLPKKTRCKKKDSHRGRSAKSKGPRVPRLRL